MSKIMNWQRNLAQSAPIPLFAQPSQIHMINNAESHFSEDPYPKKKIVIPTEPTPEEVIEQEKEEDIVFVPRPDNRFPLAVLIIVVLLGTAFLILNLKILDEIKSDRQT